MRYLVCVSLKEKASLYCVSATINCMRTPRECGAMRSVTNLQLKVKQLDFIYSFYCFSLLSLLYTTYATEIRYTF